MKKISIAFLWAVWIWGWHLFGIASATEVSAHGGWLHTSNSNYSDSVVSGVRVEQPVYNGLSLGIEGEYHGATDLVGYGDLSGFSLLGEAIYYTPKVKRLEPYIFGGLGWSWWRFDESDDMISRDIHIDMGDSLAYKVGVGAYYPIAPSWSLGIEWSYFKTDIPKDSHYSDGSFANILGDDRASGEITMGWEETNLVARVRYEF